MFKQVPADISDDADPIAVVLEEMDHFGIEKAMLGIGSRANTERTNAHRALKEHPDRFFCSYEVDPNRGMIFFWAMPVRNRVVAAPGVYS